jgi:hypothetical protein
MKGANVVTLPRSDNHPTTDVRRMPRLRFLGPNPETPFEVVESSPKDGATEGDLWLADSAEKSELDAARDVLERANVEAGLTLQGGGPYLAATLGSSICAGGIGEPALVTQRTISWDPAGGWFVTLGTGYVPDFLAVTAPTSTKGQVVGVGKRGGIVVRLPRYGGLKIEVGLSALVAEKEGGRNEGEQVIVLFAPCVEGAWGTVEFPDACRAWGVWSPDAPPNALKTEILTKKLFSIRNKNAELSVGKDGTIARRGVDAQEEYRDITTVACNLGISARVFTCEAETVAWEKKKG